MWEAGKCNCIIFSVVNAGGNLQQSIGHAFSFGGGFRYAGKQGRNSNNVLKLFLGFVKNYNTGQPCVSF